MKFWIGMLVLDLLIPFTMIGFGLLFTKYIPKKINLVFGYRTAMSTKNKDTWDFAHKYFGKIWFVGGLVLLQVTAVAMLCLIESSRNLVEKVGCAICIAQLVFMIGTIIPTELALHRTFDKDGNRRVEQ